MERHWGLKLAHLTVLVAAIVIRPTSGRAATMSVASGAAGTTITFSALGFDPGTRKPKATLVPTAGGRPVPLKVLSASASGIDARHASTVGTSSSTTTTSFPA